MATTNEYADLKPLGNPNQDFEYRGLHPKKKPKIAVKTLIKKKNGCRGIHHSCHSPHLELEFCKTCDAYVQIRGHNICQCCAKTVVKFVKHTWLSRVLKFGIKQHANFIRDWSRYPDQGVEYRKLKKPYSWIQTYPDGTKKTVKVIEGFVKKPKHSQYLEVKYRDTVYEIEVKFLALALETIKEDAKLAIIKKHVGIKGLRIWIGDDENYEYFPKQND